MNEVYNKAYYDQYDVGVGKVNYENSAYTKDFLISIADCIVDTLHPKSVLDAGCAMGYLVAALRDRGVEAYGVDISEYAISKVRDDIKPYCVVGSLTEPLPDSLPKQYDLVITIEVLEHLYEEDGKKAIVNLCKLSDRIIFSSTPDDFTERTHFNVQQREYWARLFAAEGFFDDINYRPTFLTAYASCYKKSDNWLRQVEDYERNIRISEAEHDHTILEWRGAVNDKEQHIQNLNAMHSEARQQWDAQAEQYRLKQEADAQTLAERAEQLEQYRLKQEADAQTLAERAERLDQYRRQREADQQLLAEQAERLEQYRVQRESDVQALAEQTEQLGQYRQQREMDALLLADQSEQLEQYRLHQESDIRDLAEKAELIDQYRLRQESDEQMLTDAEKRCDEIEKELAHYKEHYLAAINQREDLKQQLAQVQNAYNVISNAFFWKITKPFRVALDGVKSLLKKNYYTHLMCRGLKCWRENGFSYTWKKVQDRRYHRQNFAKVARPIFTPEELEQQRNDVFSRDIKFSILVPLYNTPAEFLHEMIRSVLDQTYENWELCMTDGSDEDHYFVEKICRQYVKKDNRIQYKKLEKNFGISENTNACIDMASGDYIALFDHDDLLHPAALHEVMKAICEQDADFVYTDENTFHKKPEDAYCPHFKEDYAPDTLCSYNYICHLSVFSRELLEKAGNRFRPEYDGSQDYDMILRLTEKAEHIVHIPETLYYWRSHDSSVASDVSAKPYTLVAAKKALTEHLRRLGLKGVVCDSRIPSTYRIQYEIEECPLVSILIPNKDHIEDLKRCIDSIKEKTTYPSWELIVIENNSSDHETFAFYEELQMDLRIRVVRWEREFNYSAINNFGAQYARGEYLLLLNNDTEIISPEWIEQMLMYCQRKDVGAAGAMLYYPDDTIQHAGVILGIGGVAGHSHKYFKRGEYGYMSRLTIAQNLSAVTAACIMVRREVWDKLEGLDEEFAIAFNDVDFCMRVRRAGYLIVWTPYAELYHYESKSRGLEDTPEKQKRFAGEVQRFQSRWAAELAAGDPYYNLNLTLDREDFSLR